MFSESSSGAFGVLTILLLVTFFFKHLFFPQAHVLDPKHKNENLFNIILGTILRFPIKDLGI